MLSLPLSNINSAYYSRQVYIYNMGIGIFSKGKNKTIFILGLSMSQTGVTMR